MRRDITVAELFDHCTDSWKEEVVRECMGERQLQAIANSAIKPKEQTLVPDRLIWNGSKGGSYSTKAGYLLLVQQHRQQVPYTEAQQRAWEIIWSWKGVIPRVLTFIWRAVHGGLATASELHRRIRQTSPMCQQCGTENEFLTHLFFFCSSSRATWFASNMALRVSDLPLDFTTAILEVTSSLEEEQITSFCNILWCIWKARNREIFSGKKETPQGILRQAQLMEVHILRTTELPQTVTTSRVNIAATTPGTQIILLDASWDTNKRGGWGAVYYNHMGNVRQVQCGSMYAEDPFYAEAKGLLNVLQSCQSQGLVQRGETTHIFSDCKTMVTAIQCNELADLPSWRASETVAQCILILQQWGEACSLRYVTRRALSEPHKLANMARRNETNFNGNPGQGDIMGITITSDLDGEWFQISN